MTLQHLRRLNRREGKRSEKRWLVISQTSNPKYLIHSHSLLIQKSFHRCLIILQKLLVQWWILQEGSQNFRWKEVLVYQASLELHRLTMMRDRTSLEVPQERGEREALNRRQPLRARQLQSLGEVELSHLLQEKNRDIRKSSSNLWVPRNKPYSTKRESKSS